MSASEGGAGDGAEVRVGTAGWALSRARAGDVPPAGTHLQRYAARLNAVEINSSFYRPHRSATYARWAASVPAGFRFAVKVPKVATHERRLAGCADVLTRFASEVAGLGPALGPLLAQLPPSLPFVAAVAHEFFATLHACTDAPVVCEPRHRSWFTPAVDRFLRDRRIARVAADPSIVAGGGEPAGWAGLVYCRLHGSPRLYASDYACEALAAIVKRLAGHAARGVPTWCIFDNTALGHALHNALAVTAATTVRDRITSA